MVFDQVVVLHKSYSQWSHPVVTLPARIAHANSIRHEALHPRLFFYNHNLVMRKTADIDVGERHSFYSVICFVPVLLHYVSFLALWLYSSLRD
jgi:hypothetical protein